MKKYKKRIGNRTLTSQDLTELVDDLEAIIKQKKRGHTEISKDDLKHIKVIQFLLTFYEEDKEQVHLGTRENNLSHHKVRDIINELELNNIITYVTRGIGGYFNFQISEMTRYRNYLYKLIEEVIDKVPASKINLDSIKNFNWKSHLREIIIGVIIGVIVLLIGIYLQREPPEPPRVEIESVSFSPTTFRCDQYSEFDIKYKVAHIGGKEVGFGQPNYVFVNQTKNTCLNNFTFFNNTPKNQGLCYNTFYKDDDVVEACNPKFDPINRETILVESHQSSFANNMIMTFQDENVSDCEISEQIYVCVELDGENYCSREPKSVDITYQACS